MKEKKNFWDKNAGRYDRFMRKDRAAYDEMYELIRPVVNTGISVPEIFLFFHGYIPLIVPHSRNSVSVG